MKKIITLIAINCLIIQLSFGQGIGLKIGDIAPELAYNNPKGEKMKLSNKLLNRNWSIDGTVEKGRQMGKTIGFPTCNIDIKNYVIAKPGVYSVSVKVNNSNKIFNITGDLTS